MVCRTFVLINKKIVRTRNYLKVIQFARVGEFKK